MKNFTPLVLALSVGLSLSPEGSPAQTQDASSVRFGEAALTFAAGSIQKSTPRDGIVNLITGDNQTTGDRMILGKSDVLYLKLNNPAEVAVGDLFTVYRRVRKVFHPMTAEYLGLVTIRLAVVRAVQADHSLTTVEVIQSYGAIAPGDPVMRYTQPPSDGPIQTGDSTDIRGMIVELQADKTVTLVSQADVVFLDRGREDGVKPGDVMEIYRQRGGLPSRKIGQLKVLSTEGRTATARILKATTRIMKGDKYKLAASPAPLSQPVDQTPVLQVSQVTPVKAETSVSPDLVARTLKAQDASGQTRINLGTQANFLRYDSGEAVITPEGYKMLDQLIEHLRTSGDARLIRVEGHADNVEIGPALKSRYPSNWELSKARASGVIRYLMEKGGLDSARLSSVGYGDSKPAATNANEEGRTKNRRVEILLYATSETELESPKPGLPGTANGPGDPSLSARGTSDQPVAPPDAANTAVPAVPSSADQRQDIAPTVNGSEELSVPNITGTALPDSAASDVSKPASAPHH